MHFSNSVKQQQLMQARAHGLRQALTVSEARLWSQLKGRQQLGVAFRRQVPLAGRYIADFVAPERKLIIEVDGGYHARRSRADERRDEKIRRLGYRVLRLAASLVMQQLPVAVQLVRQALAG
jgi:very-short-patch-repair endonuclease